MLEHLEPQKVFHYFEEICQIPHGSYHTTEISNYLVAFAKEHGFDYQQDELENVIIFAPATKGYEDREPIMIQGHMDMVAVKDEDCKKDLLKEGLDLAIDGDDIYAKGTSLGGDDGIAIAYALAILDSEDIPHPALDIVITVNEETGMEGAAGIDLSSVKARQILNIDSEKEGELTVACAGGARIKAKWDVAYASTESEGSCYHLTLSGLAGGHSGIEIGKNGANAIKLMAETLYVLQREVDFHLISFTAGTKDNVIPNSASVYFQSKTASEELASLVEVMEESLRADYEKIDKELSLRLEKVENTDYADKSANQAVMTMHGGDFLVLLEMLLEVPNGVYKMSPDLEGLVQTSSNLAVISMKPGLGVSATYSVRSSVVKEKIELCEKIEKMATEIGGTVERTGDYPGWAYRKDSPLRDRMVDIYKRMYGEEPVVLSIHAGLECGIWEQKLGSIDCVSFGPNMKDIHTTGERLSISSTQRVWEYLKEVLK